MRAVVQFSGGVGSWAAAKRSVERFGQENVTLLFADTLIEDEDLYRFLDDAEANIGVPITRIADGRTPWQVFKDVRFIGNTRADPCSQILKRDLLRKWIEEHCDPDDTTVVLGIDWTEIHRFERARPRWQPWELWAPMCDEPLIDKREVLAWLRSEGVEPPRLYAMGFPHNNCGGFCVKAGQAQFVLLLEEMPERYRWHEEQEEAIREYLDKDVSIMKDRRDNETKPLTMRTFRQELEAVPVSVGAPEPENRLFDPNDWGGCGCALD